MGTAAVDRSCEEPALPCGIVDIEVDVVARFAAVQSAVAVEKYGEYAVVRKGGLLGSQRRYRALRHGEPCVVDCHWPRV